MKLKLKLHVPGLAPVVSCWPCSYHGSYMYSLRAPRMVPRVGPGEGEASCGPW